MRVVATATREEETELFHVRPVVHLRDSFACGVAFYRCSSPGKTYNWHPMNQADVAAQGDLGSGKGPKQKVFRVRSPGSRLEFEFLQRRLYDASTIIFGVTVLLILMQLLIGGAPVWSVMVVDALCLVAGIAGRIAHSRKRPRLGWWLLSGILIGAITWNVAFHGGIDAPAVVQYVVLVAVVTRILGARAGVITATVCLVALAAAAWAHTAGALPESRLAQLAWRHALTGAITVALLAELMWYGVRQDSMQSEARERLEDFASASGGWFWESDAGGRLFWASEGAALSLRVSPEWIVGKTLWELDERTENGAGAAARVLRETVRKGEPIRAFRVLRRDGNGQDRWFEISGLPTLTSNGQLQGYRGVALNATPSSAAAEPH
jgi:PAS domain-containing protein